MGSGLNSRSFKKIVESNNSDEEVYLFLNETHGKSESSNSEEKDDNLLRGETYSRSLKKIVKSNDPEESIVLNDKVWYFFNVLYA
uniref:Uncharacterized protein n=1 Tax=Panagrolaimus superbus TaxID=310955 RepID=A0A914Y414_9BILA